MQITQCLHAAILVSDLNRAEHFYGEILKLPKTERSRNFPGSWYQIGAAKEQLINYNCPIQASASGRRALFTQDPDGNIIELSEQ